MGWRWGNTPPPPSPRCEQIENNLPSRTTYAVGKNVNYLNLGSVANVVTDLGFPRWDTNPRSDVNRSFGQFPEQLHETEKIRPVGGPCIPCPHKSASVIRHPYITAIQMESSHIVTFQSLGLPTVDYVDLCWSSFCSYTMSISWSLENIGNSFEARCRST